MEKTAQNSRSLLDIDMDLTEFLKDHTIPWYEMLDFLKSIHPETARELYDDSSLNTVSLSTRNSGLKRHLILFNPEDNDCLIRLTLSLGTMATGGSLDAESSIGNSIHRSIISKLSAPSWSQLSLDIFAVSREGIWTEAEDRHIDSLVQLICLWVVDHVGRKHRIL
jgi:hypothetical protein